jgi:hypothetical protein
LDEREGNERKKGGTSSVPMSASVLFPWDDQKKSLSNEAIRSSLEALAPGFDSGLPSLPMIAPTLTTIR